MGKTRSEAGDAPVQDATVPSTADATVPESDEIRTFTVASPTVFRRRLLGIGAPVELTLAEHGAFRAAGVVTAPWGD